MDYISGVSKVVNKKRNCEKSKNRADGGSSSNNKVKKTGLAEAGPSSSRPVKYPGCAMAKCQMIPAATAGRVSLCVYLQVRL